MKKKLGLFSHAAVVAITASSFCLAHEAIAQAPRAPGGGAAEAESSMAGHGAKPSKAELAKLNAEKAGATKPAAAAATTAKLDGRDRAFIMEAAKSGMMGVQMGGMAAKQGQSAEVKTLGSQMASDHTQANNQLMSLAQAKGVKVDTKVKMPKMSGDKFDQQWLAMMVTDHQKNIAAFETEAKTGMDPATKAWAAKTLPTLKKHLKMVQAAQKKMPKAG